MDLPTQETNTVNTVVLGHPKDPFTETLKEIGRLAVSLILSFFVVQLSEVLVTMPQLIDLWGVDFPLKAFVQFVVLPIAIRAADKFKFVEDKNTQAKVVETQLEVGVDEPQAPPAKGLFRF